MIDEDIGLARHFGRLAAEHPELETLTHLCKCACVQDFYDYEQFEQERFDTRHFSKHRMVVRSSTPMLAHNH